MGYLGGKFKIRYQISEFINSLAPRVYVEAFCGYCWVGERVRCHQRFFSDMNVDLVMMWQELLKGWKPPTRISEAEYERLKNDPRPSALRGFAGTACAFGGGFFNTYARDRKDPTKNFAEANARQMMRRVRGLRGATFRHMDYRKAMDSVDADVIYLDPPYADTTQYVAVGDFDSNAFWDEVRRRSDGRRRILVSEYKAPRDFTVVLKAYSRMGLRTREQNGNGLTNELREECLYEFEPPRRGRSVSFSSLLEV